MKILTVAFSNLNSLLGSHSIDFASGPLAEAGIFVISGPTGAGKSTILDAITLALFGRAARYDQPAAVENVMSRAAGTATAEVAFRTADGNEYRASWQLHRARKDPNGKVQAVKRYIYDAEGRELASKVRECDELVAKLVGLDADRFFRSAMLAQGEFAKFLKAKEDERAALLESLTSTHIYSRLSSAAFRRYQDSQREIEKQQSLLDSVELLSDEEVELRRTAIASHAAARAAIEVELAAVVKRIERIEARRQLERELAAADASLEAVRRKFIAFEPQRRRLEKHREATAFRSDLAAIDTRTLELREVQDRLDAQREAFAEVACSHSALLKDVSRQAADRVRDSLEQVEQMNARAKTLAAECDSLKQWLAEHRGDAANPVVLRRLQELSAAISIAAAESASRTAALASVRNDLLAAEADRSSAADQHAAGSAEFERASEKLQAMTAARNADFGTASVREFGQAVNAKRQALARVNELRRLAADAAASERRAAQLRDRVAAANERFVSLSNQLSMAEVEFAAAEAEAVDLAAKLRQLVIIKSLEEHRHTLRNGAPCPLCGALEHPFASADDVAADEGKLQVQSDLAAEELRVKRAAVLELQSAQARIDAERQAVESNLRDEAEAVEVAQRDVAALRREIGMADDVEAGSSAIAAQSLVEKLGREIAEAEAAELRCGEADVRIAEQKLALEKSRGISQASAQVVNAAQQRLESTRLKACDAERELEDAAARYREAVETFFSQADSGGWLPTPGDSPQALLARMQAADDAFRCKRDAFAEVELRQAESRDAARAASEAAERLSRLCIFCSQAATRLSTACEATGVDADSAASGHVELQSHDPDAVQRRIDDGWELLRRRQAELESAAAEASRIERKLAEESAGFRGRLQDTEFDSVESVRLALLPDEEAAGSEAEVTRLALELQAGISLRGEKRDRLDVMEPESAVDDDTLAELGAKRERLVAEAAAESEAATRLDEQLKADAKTRERQAARRRELDEQRERLRTRRVLAEMIGSADGKVFRVFAQGLVLEHLVHNANMHLSRFSDRYVLERLADRLDFEVCDLHQACARRPIASLSGGESFLVSLALALGLADLSGADVQINSLFIDEGFGTLDPATLDVALASLESLRGNDKTIGVISHVELLKERITTQIQVDKLPGGYSRLRVVG